MPLLTPGPDKGRYIIHSDDPQAVANFIEQARADSELELADTIGPPGAPHTAVFVMPHEKAQALQQQFAAPNANNRLIIERDRPLSLFENGGN
jgi:hypothetical protein